MKRIFALFALFLGMGALPAQACTSGPIYGIWFYQQQDMVTIVSRDHVHTDVTNEDFGTQYTDAATQGCIDQGYPPVYLVRYRQDPLMGWVVYCYSDETAYVVISGAQFGQATIDAAVARASCIVYGCTSREI